MMEEQGFKNIIEFIVGGVIFEIGKKKSKADEADLRGMIEEVPDDVKSVVFNKYVRDWVGLYDCEKVCDEMSIKRRY